MLTGLFDAFELFVIESELADACSHALSFVSEGLSVIFLLLPQLLLVHLNDASV